MMAYAVRSAMILIASLYLSATSAVAQVTLLFDGSGPERGVTAPGTRDFSFMGSTWTGGIVRTEGILPLYASGSFSYEIDAGGGAVTFDTPVASATWFYVHGFGFAAGTATAFDAGGTVVAAVQSRSATAFADPANFVTVSPEAPITRIEFSAGVIDNFSFVTAAVEPTATPTPRASPTCPGDCDGNGAVTVNELIRGVNIALGMLPLVDCPVLDSNADDMIAINDLIAAVNAALAGCER